MIADIARTRLPVRTLSPDFILRNSIKSYKPNKIKQKQNAKFMEKRRMI